MLVYVYTRVDAFLSGIVVDHLYQFDTKESLIS